MRGRILVLVGVGILLVAIFALQARHPASGEAQFASAPICDTWDTCSYGRKMIVDMYRSNLPLETAIERADVIALIEVEEVMPARFNTPDGQRPPGITWDDEDKHKLAAIFSPTQVKVEQYLKGPSEADHLTLYKLGGMVDDVEVEWRPVVEWEEGMRGIVLLQRTAGPDWPWLIVTFYEFKGDEAVSELDFIAMSVEELITQIEAAVP